jgi:hypothetical protein
MDLRMVLTGYGNGRGVPRPYADRLPVTILGMGAIPRDGFADRVAQWRGVVAKRAVQRRKRRLIWPRRGADSTAHRKHPA